MLINILNMQMNLKKINKTLTVDMLGKEKN